MLDFSATLGHTSKPLILVLKRLTLGQFWTCVPAGMRILTVSFSLDALTRCFP